MNRRDIIIVAVLINAGLLVTLFVSSLKSSHEAEISLAPSKSQEVERSSPLVSEKSGKDQIDQVISQYTAMAKTEEKKEDPIPLPVLTPTPKEETKVQTSSPLRVVTVEKGDVLEKIARSHGVSVDEIMKLNSLANSRLQIGQELKLPEKKAQKPLAPPKKDDGKYYVVKAGDNPWTIAQKNGMQVDELLQLNNMDEEKAKRLRPGDRLRIK